MLGAVSGAKTIGRYFTVVSFLPSVPFVAYVVLLVRSGAWGGNVHFGQALAKVDAVDGLFLAIGSLVFAMAVHPPQFAIVQAFEGYWGDSGPAARVGRGAFSATGSCVTGLTNAPRISTTPMARERIRSRRSAPRV